MSLNLLGYDYCVSCSAALLIISKEEVNQILYTLQFSKNKLRVLLIKLLCTSPDYRVIVILRDLCSTCMHPCKTIVRAYTLCT